MQLDGITMRWQCGQIGLRRERVQIQALQPGISALSVCYEDVGYSLKDYFLEQCGETLEKCTNED